MRNPTLRTVTLASVCSLAVLVLTAGTLMAGDPERRLPKRYAPGQQDRHPAVVEDASTGWTFAAWSYRDGGEYAVALSARPAGGEWSEPQLIGLRDGLNQIRPRLALDERGSVYLAFQVVETGAVRMSALPAWDRSRWFTPQTVSESGERASTPNLRVIASRVVLAYESDDATIKILDWPAMRPVVNPDGVQDGPDGFPLPLLDTPPSRPVDRLPGEQSGSSSVRRERGGSHNSDTN